MVDYSKWKNITLSDDEDEEPCHKKVDAAERTVKREQASVEGTVDKERVDYELNAARHNRKMAEIEAKKKMGLDVSGMMREWTQEDKKLAKTKRNLYDKLRKTAAASVQPTPITMPILEPMQEKDRAQLGGFIEEYQSRLLEYGQFSKMDETIKFLKDNKGLMCSDTTNFLGMWSVELALKGRLDQFQRVTYQAVLLQCLLEFAKQLKLDPQTCMDTFFSRMAHVSTVEYQKIFDNELRTFRIRAKIQAEDSLKKLSPEEQRHIVLESVPPELKESIESEDTEEFNDTIKTLSEEDKQYHLSRCGIARLWTPKSYNN